MHKSKKVNKNNPLISVIVPTYNSERFIEDTLKSILSQNYKHFEIIIQDGASNDNTLNIINKYQRLFPSIIRYESKIDNGQLDAINQGLLKAKGDIITYINSDDTYLKNAFKYVVDNYNKYPDSYMYAGYGIVIDSKGKELNNFVYKLIVKNYKKILLRVNSYTLLLCVNCFMQPSVFLNRKSLNVINKFIGVKEFILEYDTYIKLCKLKKAVVIKKELSCFRLSGENITSKQYRYLLDKDYELLKNYTNNPIILLIHRINNMLREFYIIIYNKFRN